MDYQFETLGPEHFQHLCQAILIREFPNLQCLPVAQPDGGRDAISYYIGNRRKELLVFQVKYSRNPLSIQDPHKRLIEYLEEEMPKVEKLILKQATQYILITNIPGTSHLEVGSIDKAHQIINDATGIPSQCWWRGDMARRLDSYPELKWSFPSLLTGGELLHLLLESGISEARERRNNAIRSALKDQYEREHEVRFKQVELQNKLLDLFIDVPLTLRAGPKKQIRDIEINVFRNHFHELAHEAGRSGNEGIGAATVLLNETIQTQVSRLVVEGAPGQGKSTVVQYVCQIHRRRILGEPIDLPEIQQAHRNCPIRLPFKIDLRDFSLWLSRLNPFASDESEPLPTNWHKSLESFLAAQISHQSGGASFSIEDLHAVAKNSPLLLIFDGLDEVAELSRRREVVDEITRSLNRLEAVAASIQAVITSRPAAFSNAPGFSETQYVYCDLNSITTPLINNYAERWIKARKLQGKEASDIRKILREKLDLPHLRELVRNPMQLAILLSLINTLGSSLPDKRTALYDAYVDLFFSRETEKSSIVREHRDLLVAIHRYLAWVLHSESETSGNRGSVSADRLKTLVFDYLTSEGHDSSIVDQLFNGLVQRVVALVSRVQGTYEFEVQPLREYFAARHLYETAPYSPTGTDKPGTLPDRFDALARNLYWLNVTRFYAGCYSKGELSSLVDRIEELSKDPLFSLTRHPQDLATTLLSDWVFTKQPKSMKQLVTFLLDGIGLRHMLVSLGRRARRQVSVVLPKGCGNEQLVDRCFEALKSEPKDDYADILTDVINENATKDEIRANFMKGLSECKPTTKAPWVRYGLNLGVLSSLSHEEVDSLLSDSPFNLDIVRSLLHGGQRSYFEQTNERFQFVVDSILSKKISLRFPNSRGFHFDLLSEAVNASAISHVFDMRGSMSASDVLERHYGGRRVSNISNVSVDSLPYSDSENILMLSSTYTNELKKSAAEWSMELTPWNTLVEEARRLFGERWAFYNLANFAAGVGSKDDKCLDADELFDGSTALCRRARRARLRSGSSVWWKQQFNEASTIDQKMLALLLFLSWAGPETLKKHVLLVDRLLKDLSSEFWTTLMSSLRLSRNHIRRVSQEIQIHTEDLPSTISDRTVVAYSIRSTDASKILLFNKFVPNVREGCARFHGLIEDVARILIADGTSGWEKGLPIIADTYETTTSTRFNLPYMYANASRAESMPGNIALKILQNPNCYPCDVVAIAEMKNRERLASNVVPVGKVAIDDKWVFE